MGNKLYLRVMSKFSAQHGQIEATSSNEMMYSNLENFAKLLADYSFQVAHFGALHFGNHDELEKTPLSVGN